MHGLDSFPKNVEVDWEKGLYMKVRELKTNVEINNNNSAFASFFITSDDVGIIPRFSKLKHINLLLKIK